MSNIPIRGNTVKSGNAIRVPLLVGGPVIRDKATTGPILAQNGSNQAEDGSNQNSSNVTMAISSFTLAREQVLPIVSSNVLVPIDSK